MSLTSASHNAARAVEHLPAAQLRVGNVVRFTTDRSLLGRTFKVTSVQTTALHPRTVLVSAAEDRARNVVTMRLDERAVVVLVSR